MGTNHQLKCRLYVSPVFLLTFFFSVLGSNPESYFVFILSLARFHDWRVEGKGRPRTLTLCPPGAAVSIPWGLLQCQIPPPKSLHQWKATKMMAMVWFRHKCSDQVPPLLGAGTVHIGVGYLFSETEMMISPFMSFMSPHCFLCLSFLQD